MLCLHMCYINKPTKFKKCISKSVGSEARRTTLKETRKTWAKTASIWKGHFQKCLFQIFHDCRSEAEAKGMNGCKTMELTQEPARNAITNS